VVIFVALVVPLFGHATIQEDIDARNKQIQELQKQIDQYQQQIQTTSSKAKTLSGDIGILNAQIGKLQLEIKSLSLSITQTNGDIMQTQAGILDAQQKLALRKDALGGNLQTVYEVDQNNLTEVLFRNARLSEFFNNVQRIQDTQDTLRQNILDIKQLKSDLEQREEDLQDKRSQLDQLKKIQEVQKSTLDQNKNTKDKILKETKGQEAKYQQLVKQTADQISRIRMEITSLQANGITAEDAVKYAQLSAISAGIRPAFLLGILEVESRLGQNVGKGNWQDDMVLCYQRLAKAYPAKRDFYLKRAETEKNAFLKITSQLGLDPNALKVSKEPVYGCGGAMGPAQFIPSTWVSYADQVGRLTGHNPPNPWNIQDAFTASAIKLARGGATAKTRASEIAAAKAYISGNSKCSTSTCNYYANAVLDKAAAIERDLGTP